jgi:hypothetical protein
MRLPRPGIVLLCWELQNCTVCLSVVLGTQNCTVCLSVCLSVLGNQNCAVRSTFPSCVSPRCPRPASRLRYCRASCRSGRGRRSTALRGCAARGCRRRCGAASSALVMTTRRCGCVPGDRQTDRQTDPDTHGPPLVDSDRHVRWTQTDHVSWT